MYISNIVKDRIITLTEENYYTYYFELQMNTYTLKKTTLYIEFKLYIDFSCRYSVDI